MANTEKLALETEKPVEGIWGELLSLAGDKCNTLLKVHCDVPDLVTV